MKREITYLQDLDIVLVKTTGRYIFQEELQTIKDAFEVMQENNCCNLFFDHRETEVVASAGAAVARTADYPEVGISRTTKIACVGRDEDYEDLKFFELVGNNRGWKTRLFTSYDEAINWLTK